MSPGRSALLKYLFRRVAAIARRRKAARFGAGSDSSFQLDRRAHISRGDICSSGGRGMGHIGFVEALPLFFQKPFALKS